jgi:hypothetical protein
MSDADASTKAKRDWVIKVLGVPLDDESALKPARVRGRLNEVGLRLRELSAFPDLLAELRPMFAEAVQLLKDGNFDDVTAILDEIDDETIGLMSGARGQEAARVIGSANAWRGAVANIASTLESFKASVIQVLVTQEHEDEEIDDVSEQLDLAITDITGKLDEGLADQVDAVINGDPSRRAAGVETILKTIQSVEDQIVKHDGVREMENNGVIPLAITTTAKTALDELRAALNEAVAQASKVAA